MKLHTLAPVGALAALTLAGCAAGAPQAMSAGDSAPMASAEAPQRSCFRLGSIRGQNVIDRQTVLFGVGVGQREVYQMKMRGACLDNLNNDPLVLIPTGGSDQICDRMDMSVRVSTPIGSTPCLIESVRKLTPAEVAALTPDQRP